MVDPAHFAPLFARKPRAQVMLYREALLELGGPARRLPQRALAPPAGAPAARRCWRVYALYEAVRRRPRCWRRWRCATRRGAYGADVPAALLASRARRLVDAPPPGARRRRWSLPGVPPPGRGRPPAERLRGATSDRSTWPADRRGAGGAGEVGRDRRPSTPQHLAAAGAPRPARTPPPSCRPGSTAPPRRSLSYADFLQGLLEEEAVARANAATERRLRQAGFPYAATIEQFDFRFRPDLKRQVVLRYLDPTFVEQARSLALIGAPGLGKTMLADLRRHQARPARRHRPLRHRPDPGQPARARCTTAMGRQRLLKPLLACDVLVLDELGYLPTEPGFGPALYELIAGRYERRPTIITSNKSLTEWGAIVQDASLAAALVDRILHHGDVFYLKGPSWRLEGRAVEGSSTDAGTGVGCTTFIPAPRPLDSRRSHPSRARKDCPCRSR